MAIRQFCRRAHRKVSGSDKHFIPMIGCVTSSNSDSPPIQLQLSLPYLRPLCPDRSTTSRPSFRPSFLFHFSALIPTVVYPLIIPTSVYPPIFPPYIPVLLIRSSFRL